MNSKVFRRENTHNSEIEGRLTEREQKETNGSVPVNSRWLHAGQPLRRHSATASVRRAKETMRESEKLRVYYRTLQIASARILMLPQRLIGVVELDGRMVVAAFAFWLAFDLKIERSRAGGENEKRN